MLQRVGVIAIAFLGLGGCASDPDKLWYKPGGQYTVADFERDRAACTKSRELDEGCLKDRGWVATSPDRAPTAKDPRKTY